MLGLINILHEINMKPAHLGTLFVCASISLLDILERCKWHYETGLAE